MFDFDPSRVPPVPRDAATVVVIRDGASGLEVFCVRRHARSGFMGGAVVFPGGKVDATDSHPMWAERSTDLTQRAKLFGREDAPARTFAVAALRESLEEAAIMPVVGGALDGDAAERLRRGLEAHSSLPPLAVALERLGLQLDLRALQAFARWVTPTAERRRYDTRFYLLPAPPDQQGCHDEYETTQCFWATPRQILERWEAGRIQLAPPTSRSIEILLEARTTAEAIDLAQRQPLDAICPHLVVDGQETILTLPGDPLHPEFNGLLAPLAGPSRFVLRDGRFVAVRSETAAAH